MRIALPVLLLLSLAGCSHDSAPATTVRVELVIPGSTIVIDADWITANPSPLPWGEGRAWRLGSILGPDFDEPTARLRVTPRDGDPVVFEGTRRDGREPLLVVNRKGAALVTLGDPDAGPGAFHGRGGARKRAGDAATRVLDVVRIELEFGAAPTTPVKKLEPIAVLRGGDTQAAENALTLGALAGVPELLMRADDGTALEPTYRDLRAVSQALWGGRAVTAVLGGSPPPVAISAEAWADADRVPALRINKEGLWRFQWFQPGGGPIREHPGVRNVTQIHLAP
jgi:hypothetical protein